MALPSSGQISMSQVNTELGLTVSAQISLNDAAVRTLFGVASGAISLDNGHGKANAFLATISSNHQQLNLRTWALANGWNGSSVATITVGSGVYIWSDSTSIAGLTIDGAWPGGITLVNNGFIMGKGGQGGNATSTGGNGSGNPGLTGGNAISLGTTVILNSSAGYVAGGGGGGGSSQLGGGRTNAGGGGGGAGGGAGGSSSFSAAGGTGGSIGTVGANGSTVVSECSSGAGGGRIIPGTGGLGSLGGAGFATGGGAGGGGGSGYKNVIGRDGGSSSNVGVSGVDMSGGYTPTQSGGGGGWGAQGGKGGNWMSFTTTPGGGGGKAVALNGYTVTWVGGFPSGQVFGAVS